MPLSASWFSGKALRGLAVPQMSHFGSDVHCIHVLAVPAKACISFFIMARNACVASRTPQVRISSAVASVCELALWKVTLYQDFFTTSALTFQCLLVTFVALLRVWFHPNTLEVGLACYTRATAFTPRCCIPSFELCSLFENI